MNSNFRDALAPLARRMPRLVREHEILRISGWLPGEDRERVADLAIEEILKWAQKRSGGQLPNEAWQKQSFSHNLGGRHSDGIRLKSENTNIWAIRADDPDKKVAERVWTTEVVIGQIAEQQPRFSARLLVSTPESELAIEPHVPGFVLQLADTCGLVSDDRLLSPKPILVQTETDAKNLIDFLVDPNRKLPIFVVTLADESLEDHPSLNTASLSRAMLGLAHVALVSPQPTWQLTDHFGRFKSVFGGAARVYAPGFSVDADPYQHRLVLADQIASREGAARCTRWIRQLVAKESIRRSRLGQDVLQFAAIRNANLQLRQESLSNDSGNEVEKLLAAEAIIDALEKQVQEQSDEIQYYCDEFEKERVRADASEAYAQSSAYKVQQLTKKLKESNSDPDKDIIFPNKWSDFVEWTDEHLSGRLILTPRAQRSTKNPDFENVDTAARALLWLADECREKRINGGDGSINNLQIMEGIVNSSCGDDTYDFDWGGRRHSADWHVKSSGNTRDPVRCLRIYYCFDPQTQQIIVSDMPAHRRTGAT